MLPAGGNSSSVGLMVVVEFCPAEQALKMTASEKPMKDLRKKLALGFLKIVSIRI